VDVRSLRYLARGLKYRFFGRGFSESGEDLIASYLLGHSQGKFVDVGSGHPIVGSNTYYFSKKGWSGVAIDANPRFELSWKLLRPRDTFLSVSIGEGSDLVEFYEYENDLRSTSSKEVKDLYDSKNLGFSKRIVEQKTLTDVFRKFNLIDENIFLTIDVEGSELQVLKSLNFEQYTPALIAVESWTIPWTGATKVHQFLTEKNYGLIAYSGLTSFYLRSSEYQNFQKSRPKIEG